MNQQIGKCLVLIAIVAGVLTGSCAGSLTPQPMETILIPSATASPFSTATQTPLPTLTPTPWPTRIPQTESNCPAGGWTLFTQQNGLAEANIEAIAAGPDGVIWVGFLSGGITWIYNGRLFALPVSPNININVILPRETGGIWVADQSGKVALYENYQWVWQSFVVPIEKGGTAVYDLAVSPQGQLWAATWDGLFQLQGQEWVEIPQPVPADILYSPKSLHFDQRGGLYVGARHSFNYYRNGSWAGSGSGIPNLINMEAIEEDSTGNLWLGGLGNIFLYDGESWTKVYPEPDSDLNTDDPIMVSSLSIGPDDRVWETSNNGPAVYQDGRWLPITPEMVSADIRLSYVEVDPFRAAWFASSEGLLCYFP